MPIFWPPDAQNIESFRKSFNFESRTSQTDHIQIHFINHTVFFWHIMSYLIISYDIISYHIISYDIISYDIISYDIIWYHIIWYHMISYDMISYDIIWYDIIWYDIIWYDMIWYDIIWDDKIRHDMSKKHCMIDKMDLYMVCLTRSGLKIEWFSKWFNILSVWRSKNRQKYLKIKILGRGWSKLTFD